jgi:protoporphyrinogen oxidase
LSSVALKKGDTVVHALKDGPLLSAITAISKEVGVTLTNSADTKNARAVVVDAPPGKLAKCLGPKGVVVALSGNITAGSVAGSGVALSVTDLIFQDSSTQGFDLSSWIATADEKLFQSGNFL